MDAVTFEGKAAIVTGAGGGIGAGLARALAARGAFVVLADLDVARAEAEAEAIRAAGGQARAVRLDVTDAEAQRALVDEVVAERGAIDFMFNNAGIGLAGEVRDMALGDWRRVMEVNLFGVIHGIDAAYPRMVEQGSGYIVNTASGAGLLPRPGMTPYAASKHAVVGLSTSLRGEAEGLGIGVSAVCPGYIATDILTSTTYKGVDGEKLTANIPIKPMSADACAQIVLDGVRRRRPVIPVTRATELEWWLFRLAPNMLTRAMALRARAFRKNRAGGEG